MQNTARIPYIPNTLIQNFFIAGVTQKTLTTRISDVQEVRIPPEVLFSMYQPKENVAKYLPFVYPGQVTIELDAHAPKFYTFMSTDGDGFNSFFHCLIVFEEINEADILTDFDKVTDMLKHKNAKKRDNTVKEDDTIVGVFEKNYLNGLKSKYKRTAQKTCLNAIDIAKKVESETKDEKEGGGETPKTPRAQKELHKRQLVHSKNKQFEFRRMISKITPDILDTTARNQQTGGLRSRQPGSYNNSLIGHNNKMAPSSPTKRQEKSAVDGFLFQPKLISAQSATPLSRQNKQQEHQPEDTSISYETSRAEESMNFGSTSKKVTRQIMRDARESVTQDDDFNGGGLKKKFLINKPIVDKAVREEPNLVLCNEEEMDSDYRLLQNPEGHIFIRGSEARYYESLLQKRKYVPVAFVIETSIEHHDIFKQILLSLYDLVRLPEKLMTNSYNDDRRVAFAELVAHIAFLKTIPAPYFNSIYNIQFLGQTLTIKETAFDCIPNKNSLPIKILFDCLDIRSIFFCWKALLFDKTLVLVSSQYSLQFYCAEALKQLLFPFTWQNSYVQPGSARLLELCDGVMTMIYGSQSYVGDYDYFDGKHEDMAVVDLDASFTNDTTFQKNKKELPCIPNEQMYIRILNLLKNQRINNYDKAYGEPQVETEDFVLHVRQTFFQILKHYVRNLDDYIDRRNPETSNFGTYFDKAKYLDNFDFQEDHRRFAENLLQSSQFQHFCDDSFNTDELNNYHMLRAILNSRAEGVTTAGDSPFAQAEDQVNIVWPETTPLVFNFRIPQDNQRIMLFEKVYFMNKDHIDKKAKDTTRSTNMQIVENIHFSEIVESIKRLYPIKLKGTHLQFQAQDQKMRQVEMFKRQKGLHESNSEYSIVINQDSPAQPTRKYTNNQLIGEGREDQEDTLLSTSKVDIKLAKSNIITNQFHRQQTDAPKIPLGQMKNTQGRLDQMSTSKEENLSGGVQSSGWSLETEEIMRIQTHPQRIMKLAYGTQGLLTFLHHLFGLFQDHELKSINYYFALKEQINQLNQISKQQSGKITELGVIAEQQEDATPGSRFLTFSNTGRHNEKIGQDFNGQASRARSFVNHQLSHSRSGGPKLFQDANNWFYIEEWDKVSSCLKYSYQYILFRQKLFETFETYEDGSSKIFYDLMKFPEDKMQFFPKSKYLQIWDNLSHEQKVQLFQTLGKNQKRASIAMISKEYVNGLSKPNNGCNSDASTRLSIRPEDLAFFSANVSKSYVQKQNERQSSADKAKQLNKCSFNSQGSNKEKEIERQAFMQSKNLIKQKLKLKSGKSQEDLTLKSEFSMKHLLTKHYSNQYKNGANSDMHVQRQSADQLKNQCVSNYDMTGTYKFKDLKLKPLTEPDVKSASLLHSMMDFWRANSKFVESRGCFKASELERIQKEMGKYENSLRHLKEGLPEFNGDEVVKQCFFLNIYNFIVLHRIAVLMISDKDALKQLNNYNRWQSFLQSCQLFIGGIKIDAYQIQHYVLRMKLTLPPITRFMITSFPFESQDFQVSQPHKLIAFGFFLPLKNMPKLHVFKKKNFAETLRKEAQSYLIKKMKIKDDFRFIVIPKYIQWYLKDFKSEHQKYNIPTLYNLFSFFVTEILIDDEGNELRESIMKVCDKIQDKEKEKEFVVHFRYYSWIFNSKIMAKRFKQSDLPVPSTKP